MTPPVRASLSALAAAFGGVLATFVLISPAEWRGAFVASDRQLDAWLNALPNGIVAGVVVAVGACLMLLRPRSVRPAWICAAIAAAVLTAARLAVSGVGGLDQLTPLHYAKCIAAGVLLGAVVAAVWSRPLPRLVLVAAAGSTVVLAHTAQPGWNPSTSILGEPFWWILIPALVLAAACAVVDDTAPERVDRDTTIGVLAAVVTLALVHRLLGEWIERQSASRFQSWVVIALCLVLVVALTEFWARRLDSPFLLAATAVAAASPIVAALVSQDHRRLAPWVLVVVGIAAVGAGLAVATRWPSPGIGLALLAAAPLAVVVDPTPSGRVWVVGLLAVLCAGIGLVLGSTLPGSAAAGALGLTVPLLSLVFTTTIGITTSYTIYRGSYEPLPGTPFAMPFGWSTVDPGRPIAPVTVTFDRAAAVAVLLVVVFCGLAIRGLRARQPAPRAD